METDSSLIGYGGARGGAKSFAIRAAAVYRRVKYPGTSALIFRRVYDQLWQQHITRFAVEYPQLYARYWSAEHKSIILPDGSTILFRYGTSLKDILAYRGKEYGDIFIDEATDMSEEELHVLYSCCRTSNPPEGFFPKKVLTFNPGGIGHSYIMRVFIKQQWTNEERAQKPLFIQAYAWDNVVWVKDALAKDGLTPADYYSWPPEQQRRYFLDKAPYAKELSALPEHLRLAWLEGRWDVYIGQAFPDFIPEVHVVEPFQIPKHWRVWMAHDLGYSSPAPWLFFAADEDGTVYVFNERTFQNMPESEQANIIADSIRHMNIDFWVCGADAWHADPSTGKQVVDYFRQAGLPTPLKPVTDRTTGAMIVHEYLKTRTDLKGQRIPRLKIFKNCRKLIETLPTLPVDEIDPEKVRDCEIDHWYDALRYGLCAWHTTHSVKERTAWAAGSLGTLLDHEATIDHAASTNSSDMSSSLTDLANLWIY